MRTRSLLLSFPWLMIAACAGGGGDDGTGGGDDATPQDTAPPMEVAKNVSISAIDLYQGPKASLMKAGAPVDHRAPVIAERAGLMRVFVTPGDGWVEHDVTCQLTLHSSGGDVTLSDTKTISGPSTENNHASTCEIAVGGVIEGDSTYSVTLLVPPGQPDGPTDGAKYPAGDPEALNAVWVGDALHIMMVPYQYNADGSGRTPDLSDDAKQAWHDAMYRLWPDIDVDVQFHDPVPWSRTISPFGSGWSDVLMNITGLRQKEGAADDVFYYAFFTPASSFDVFCNSGCVGGLANFPPGGGPPSPYIRAAAGLGYLGEFEFGTIAQELAHTIGRLHAPCGPGVSQVDPAFPYKSGNIGVTGYDLAAGSWVNSGTADFMSYCSPVFVSDYTFAGIATQLEKIAATAPNVHYGPPRAYRMIEVAGDGVATLGDELSLRVPPADAPRTVTFLDDAGRPISTGQGWYSAHDTIPGGMLVVGDAPKGAVSVRIDGIAFAPTTL